MSVDVRERVTPVASTVKDGRPLRIMTQAIALSPIGGVEVCTLEDVLALVDRDHRVDIAYMIDGVFRGSYEQAGVNLRRIRRFSFDRRRAVQDLLGYLPSAAWARLRRPDVLWLARHEHLVWAHVIARAAGVPIVAHLHGPPIHRDTKRIARGVAHFIAVSHFMREAYIASGLDPERITVVHNAVPAGRFTVATPAERVAAREALGLPLDRPIVLSYGRMNAEKGATDLLEAWDRVLEQAPDALLVLVDAMYPVPDADIAARLAARDDESVRRFPIAADVLPFLHAADVVAFPTRLPESFGRVALEGMMAGVPVVATRVGAVPEILADRFLVPAEDPAALAAALLPLLSWREDEPRLGEQLSEDAADRFPHERHVEAIEGILRAHARRR